MIASLTKLWEETDRKIDGKREALTSESFDEYIRRIADDNAYEKREALSEKLGRKLTRDEEHEIFREEKDSIIQKINGEIEILVAKLDMIETQLRSLGARKARPYEHWNEEEHIVQYLETRNDNRDY
jgi:23S rRNA pseudoU1915 N3-methylase RlmH